MNNIVIDDKELLVMNLIHYFMTEKNYNPVVVHGVNDEVWLENMNSEYKIVRIVSKYIHNNEQLDFNRFRSKRITKNLKKNTFSFKMNTLNIYTDLGDNVTELENEDNNNLSVFVKEISDIKNNPTIITAFPDIVEKTKYDEVGIELILKLTEDINNKNEVKAKKMDKIFSSKKPIATYVIIALCVVMFIISGFGFDSNLLIKFGANVGVLVKNGEIYRLVTHMFLHAGFLHLILNMYSLYIVGTKVEDFYGKWKYLTIYLLSGICGGLLSVGLNGDVLAVGASGAIFGLFGALLYFGYNYRGYIAKIIRSQILPIVIYNLLIGFFISGIDVWSHIGGLIGGVLTANMLGTIENKKYNFSNILLFIIYFAFLIYLGIFR